MYFIDHLKAAAQQKITSQLQVLGELTDGPERLAVFGLLAYAFSRLSENDLLLHWLARYASWNLDALRQMPTRFDNLLIETDGNFPRLLARYVCRSSINPFTLSPDEVKPRYPISVASRTY